MPRETVPRTVSAENSDGPVTERQADTLNSASDERQSVSELVRNYGDSYGEIHKRGRSESGDPAPAGKRGAREPSAETARSPSVLTGGSRNFRECLDTAIEGLESRIMLSLSRDLHDFRETLSAEVSRLNERLRDLERHVEEKDIMIDELTDELRQSKEEVSALRKHMEDAEINSRLPCLILSGAAMASRHAPRLEPPLPARTAAAEPVDRPPGQGQAAATSQSDDRRVGPAGGRPEQSAGGLSSDQRDVRARSAAPGAGWEQEDVNGLVISVLNRCMPGLGIIDSDIDRAHRLPGPNNRVIVRFVRSGQNSVRDQVMSRRLELRGRELYVNESLTKLRGLIFRSLLAAKRDKKIYTVYSRGGQVYFKERQHGVGTRVDSLERLRELGHTVLER